MYNPVVIPENTFALASPAALAAKYDATDTAIAETITKTKDITVFFAR